MLYNLAKIFIMTSSYEGFGMTLLEAMACGCPAVAAKTGASPEVSGGAACWQILAIQAILQKR